MGDTTHQLLVKTGPQIGRIYTLTLDKVTIGRDPMSDVVVNDPEVSRNHARLSRTEGEYTLQDLGSTNGSFVDGKRLSVEAVPLSAGQMVGLGSNVLMEYQVVVKETGQGTVMAMPAFEPLPTENPPAFPEPILKESNPLPIFKFDPEPVPRSAPVPIFEQQTMPLVEPEHPRPSFTRQEYQPKTTPPPLETPVTPPPSANKQRRTTMTIVLVVLLVLCCCCVLLPLFSYMMYNYWGDPLMQFLGVY